MTARVAMLGLGAMGRRMARRLVDAGHAVTAWSRAGVPAGLGVHPAATPRAAAAEAELVIAMVTDDEASAAVWLDPASGALAALRPATIAIECSTLSPAWIRQLAARVGETGARFLDAPVVGSRPQAEAGALVILAGGDPACLDAARPVLASLAGAIHHAGATGAGATLKLIANALFAAQVAAVAELLGLARSSGLDPAHVVELLGGLPVTSPAAKAAAAGMVAGRFEPMFPIALVGKDVRYAVAAAPAGLPVTARVGEVLAAAHARGLDALHVTALAKLYDGTSPAA